MSPFLHAPSHHGEERRRVFGNEKVTNLGTSKMIILQQPRIGKSAELYTHMPSEMGIETRKGEHLVCQSRISIKRSL